MTKYFIFAWDSYYPEGGLDNFKGTITSNTYLEAQEYAHKTFRADHYKILELEDLMNKLGLEWSDFMPRANELHE